MAPPRAVRRPRWFRGGKSTSTKGVEYNADGTKKIPEGVKDMAEGLRKSLGTVDSKQVPMNCAVAVSNIHYQADLMLEVGQKNVRDGYMTQAAFDTTAPRSARPGQIQRGRLPVVQRQQEVVLPVHVQQQQPRDGLRPPVQALSQKAPGQTSANQPAFARAFALAAAAWGSRSGVVQRLALAHGGAGAFQVRHQAVQPLRLGLVGKVGLVQQAEVGCAIGPLL